MVDSTETVSRFDVILCDYCGSTLHDLEHGIDIEEFASHACAPMLQARVAGLDVFVSKPLSINDSANDAEVERMFGSPQPVQMKAGLREPLADLEHQQWSHWTSYMLDNMTFGNIKRWRSQVATPYAKLSEREKDSDRAWADKVIALATLDPDRAAIRKEAFDKAAQVSASVCYETRHVALGDAVGAAILARGEPTK